MALQNIAAERRACAQAAADIEPAKRLLRGRREHPGLLTDPQAIAVADAIERVLEHDSTGAMLLDHVSCRLFEPAEWLRHYGRFDTFQHDLECIELLAQLRSWRAAADAVHRDLERRGEISDASRAEARRCLTRAPAGHRSAGSSYRELAERQRRAPRVIRTGIGPLDKALAATGQTSAGSPAPAVGGFIEKSLVVIGAETGRGKTTFGCEIALRGLLLNRLLQRAAGGLLVFTAEEPKEMLADRIGLGAKGRWYQRLREARDTEVRLYDLADLHRPTVHNVVSHTREYVHERVVELAARGVTDPEVVHAQLPLAVVVDYSRLFASPDAPLVAGMEKVARELKEMLCLGAAFDTTVHPVLDGFGLTVLLPAQLKRPKPQSKADRLTWRPDADCLADCRSQADWADVVVLIWRPDEGDDTAAEVRVSKSRHSATSGWLPIGYASGRWGSTHAEAAAGGFDVAPYRAATAPPPAAEPLPATPSKSHLVATAT